MIERTAPLSPGAIKAYRVYAAPSKKGENSVSEATMFIYGLIGSNMWADGCISADQFRKDLNDLDEMGSIKTLNIRINSDGGDVFDAQAIYSLLVQHPAVVNVFVDGVAASAASFIAMAGNTIKIAESAFFMIHNPWGGARGDAREMRRYADMLDAVGSAIASIYTSRTGQSPADVKKWLDAETWMAGPVAVERGFADAITPNLGVAAMLHDTKAFRNLPRELRPNASSARAALDRIGRIGKR